MNVKVEVDYVRIAERPDLVPPLAAHVLAKVFGYGSLKHDEGSWREYSIKRHLIKCQSHLLEFDENCRVGLPLCKHREDHLANALCRLYMAIEVREEALLQNGVKETTDELG